MSKIIKIGQLFLNV